MENQVTITDSYWDLLDNLDAEIKLELIERLKNSLKQEEDPNKTSIKQAFGAWVEDESAEDLINEIRSSRSFTYPPTKN